MNLLRQREMRAKRERFAPISTGSIAGALFQQAFGVPRDPRSQQYKNGVRAALVYRIEGRRIPKLYEAGTADDDAFHAGIQEGHAIWLNAGEPTEARP